ncbi:MAG: hypothetical protein JSV89_09950 [Spirochaetaceae bacterium]|nr:MAG: hypothetical protein JSV89_09950 [Spirochaetaceae bacterium]
MYKLVVTGTLEFPEIYLRAVPQPQERIAEYKYKGNEKNLDSGRISVQFVADSSTYDQERNSDSYRKLVIIDKRQSEPMVRALVLPLGVFFDYPYYLHDVHDGEQKLVLITGKTLSISTTFSRMPCQQRCIPEKTNPGSVWMADPGISYVAVFPPGGQS